MVMLAPVLTVLAPLVLAFFVVAIAYKILRHIWLVLTRRRVIGPSPASDAPPWLSWSTAIGRTLTSVLHFPVRANPLWVAGFGLYHFGIITTALGYCIDALIVVSRVAAGAPVPDLAAGLPESFNYSVGNLVTLVFGNAQPMVSQFLFGQNAGLFVTVTWFDVGCALVGNLLVLVVRARKLSGAVVRDIDAPAKDTRVAGRRPALHAVISVIIFCIVMTEILGRLQVVPGIVMLHTLFGLTLLALAPFSYLWHVAYSFVALAYAVVRRRNLRTA